MSLTSHLKAKHSPVRTFFESRLPNTDGVVRTAAARLRDGREGAPLAAGPGVDPAWAGTAVDYLVRFGLASEPCQPGGGAAALGAGQLERFAPAALHAVRQGLEFVHATAAFDRPVPDREWEDLTRVSLVLARFEQCYRSRWRPAELQDLTTAPKGWREWASVFPMDAELKDVSALGRAAIHDHASLRDRNLTCNPTFTQSRSLGGADADLITDDGLLIDFKSTSTTATCGREDVWQLCGYALADTNDARKIRSVALSALRWRTQYRWDLVDLLTTLAGESVSLEHLRQDFAAVLDDLAKSRRRRAIQRQSRDTQHRSCSEVGTGT